MKNIIFLLLLSAIIFSCQDEKKPDATLVPNPIPIKDTTAILTDTTAIVKKVPTQKNTPVWRIDQTEDGNEKATKLRTEDSAYLSPEHLVEILNIENPNIKCVFKKVNGSTVFISIPNSSYFTNRSGTTGAKMFLMQAVYTLTELPNIKSVYIDFEEGDHAVPGLYTRKDFELKK